MHSRGSVSLATSSIITIIVALVTLALILGFESHGFGVASDKFLGSTESAIKTPQASSSTPLTYVSPGVVHPGKDFSIGLSAYNAGAARTLKPTLSCLDAAAVDPASLQVTAHSVASGAVSDFILIARAGKNAQPGKTPCTLAIIALDGTPALEQDIILTVE